MDRRTLALAALALAPLAACGPTEIVVGDSPGLARIVAGVAGDSGRGAPVGDARSERLLSPNGVAAGSGGSLYIADTGNRVIREVSALGVERIVAGDPDCGSPVIATVAARALCLRFPTAVAELAAGLILVADPGAHVVWAVDIPADTAAPYLGTGTAGVDSTLGQPARRQRTHEPTDVAVAADGTVWVVETGNNRVVRISALLGGTEPVATRAVGRGTAGYSGDGGLALQARLRVPRGIAVDGTDLYIADTGNHVVRRVNANGIISTVAGTGQAGFAGDEGPAAQALLSQPARVVVAGGLLMVSDRGNLRVRAVGLGTGTIGTFLGTGDAAVAADLLDAGLTATRRPEGLAVGEGFLYAADAGHHVVRRILVP
ncbi:MAG: hypothetical protein AABY85_06220 [Gemmatimonadota bacterium]